MATRHYLGFRQLVGESLKYVALLDGRWVALLAWATAAFKCRPRDAWIGWTPHQQWQRLRYVVNNQRFLLLPPPGALPNLASKTLSLNTKRLATDWQAVFGHPVVLAETFLDPARFRGTAYRAANWLLLGETRGFGRHARRYVYHGHPKGIWVRPLRPDARRLLSAPFFPPELQGKEPPLVDLNQANLAGRNGLLSRLRRIRDPRHLRGIRHDQASVLALAICAVLSQARSFVAIAQWAQKLSQDLLERLGCRYNLRLGRYVPPSEPTIRRVLQSVDADEVDRVVYAWLAEQSSCRAVAVDGKSLRGARGPDGRPRHLLAAFLHKQGAVVAQTEVGPQTNEIAAFQPLLEPLDLQGKVVTADALHAQAEHARYLVEQKQADYLFAVKGNQPGLLQAIQALDDEDFSP